MVSFHIPQAKDPLMQHKLILSKSPLSPDSETISLVIGADTLRGVIEALGGTLPAIVEAGNAMELWRGEEKTLLNDALNTISRHAQAWGAVQIRRVDEEDAAA